MPHSAIILHKGSKCLLPERIRAVVETLICEHKGNIAFKGFVFSNPIPLGSSCHRAVHVPVQVAYSEFLSLVHSGNVEKAGIDDSADKIYFSLSGHSSQQAAEAAIEAAAAASRQPEASTSASVVDPSSGEILTAFT